MTSWREYAFDVGMPHMVPEKLSEVELLKALGDFQWSTIASQLGIPSARIENEGGERLYASFLDIDLAFAPGLGPDSFGEGRTLHIRNAARFYAGRFVEGLFLVDGEPIPDAVVDDVGDPTELAGTGRTWVSLTNAFVARRGSNDRLKVFAPKGVATAGVDETPTTPSGVTAHGEVQATGLIPDFALEEEAVALRPRHPAPVPYPVVPESDLNGAGLLYFARYVAVMNFAERVVLARRLPVPASADLIRCLTTARRRLFYYANADPDETIEVHTTMRVAPPRGEPLAPRFRTPLRLLVRQDLHRRSDGVLMASALTEKALNVPARQKAVLAEADRFLARLGD